MRRPVFARIGQNFPIIIDICTSFPYTETEHPGKIHAFAFDQMKNGYYAVGEKVGQAWQSGADLMKK